MAAANCTPVSYPRLPPTHHHPMWQVSGLLLGALLLGSLSAPDCDAPPPHVAGQGPAVACVMAPLGLWAWWGAGGGGRGGQAIHGDRGKHVTCISDWFTNLAHGIQPPHAGVGHGRGAVRSRPASSHVPTCLLRSLSSL